MIKGEIKLVVLKLFYFVEYIYINYFVEYIYIYISIRDTCILNAYIQNSALEISVRQS